MHKALDEKNFLYDQCIVYDAHACPPHFLKSDPYVLERYRIAGVTLVSLNVGFGNMSERDILAIIRKYRQYASELKDRVVNRVADIALCKNEGLLGIIFDLEGTDWANSDIEKIYEYSELGVKQMVLAYNENNAAGAGYQDTFSGLTHYGQNVVKTMNAAGMIVDCSHTGAKTTLDMMEISSHPVVFSHANVFALCNHPRNISDEQIKACAKTGGVIGINGISLFLGNGDTSTQRIVEHMDYVAQLVGPQHVGIGLDYVFDHAEVKMLVKKNPSLFPTSQGYEEVEMAIPEQISEIPPLLRARGYSESDIKGILGGNFLRVAKAVWK
jgi:membrane dipeptidase